MTLAREDLSEAILAYGDKDTDKMNVHLRFAEVMAAVTLAESMERIANMMEASLSGEESTAFSIYLIPVGSQ